ncbi:hypothetical protein TEQUI_1281 [Taylorella equigenitalis MCE9]|uniref:Uncharacterized protein n=1 Tax=Taylorella equigenitalis (strain MCE9) TaxID=937774 RepID=A0A654KIB8_TAYEM|nr:hypothetical protein TEQUI_1281 [Taylorella equigenitalis MCE9]
MILFLIYVLANPIKKIEKIEVMRDDLIAYLDYDNSNVGK